MLKATVASNGRNCCLPQIVDGLTQSVMSGPKYYCFKSVFKKINRYINGLN